MSTDLRAGVARVTITPPVGIPMMGFAGRGSAAGIHDDLTATALVLEGPPARVTGGAQDGVTRLALIACDLLFLRTDEIHAVREAVGQATDVLPEHVVIACSHTHYGPLTDPGRDERASQVEAYLANLVHVLAGAVSMARARVVSCRIGFSQGSVQIGINRRERTPEGRIILGQNRAGPVDPRVAVVRIDGTDGQPVASVLNYACHPVSLGGRCTDISADFPGVARRLVEEQTGAPCVFLQSATGNINPLLMGWDWTHLARLGLPLGAEAVRAYWEAKPSTDRSSGGIGIARARLDLPPLLPRSEAEGRELVSRLEAERDQLRGGGDEGSLWWAEQRLDRALKGLDALEGGTPVPPVQAELTALRLSSAVGLVTAPGEIFTEIGQSIMAQSPFEHTLYATYTDGTIGYVPTRSAYSEGGYEVTHACHVAPEAGDLIEHESVRLLERVHTGA